MDKFNCIDQKTGHEFCKHGTDTTMCCCDICVTEKFVWKPAVKSKTPNIRRVGKNTMSDQQLAAEVAQLRSTLAAIKNALLKYGGHKDFCEMIAKPTKYRRMAGERCTCGWKQIEDVFLREKT